MLRIANEVIPAKAGIQKDLPGVFEKVTIQLIRCMTMLLHWIPAFAGMTSRAMPFLSQSYRQKPARSAIQVFFWIC
jgi:hypothetical protein